MTAIITQSGESARCRRHPLALLPFALLLLAAMALAICVGCGGMAGDAPATGRLTAEPPPSAATAVARAEATVTAAAAKAGTDYCGRLCQSAFWINASVADLDAEISKGASVNATGGVDGYKGSPLHYAVWYADISVIAALLDRGADLEAKDYIGQTALHLVAQSISEAGHKHPSTHWHSDQDNIAALLLERGADVNAQDNYDDLTPLHLARNPVVAALLVDYGADVNATAGSGWTPLSDAAWYGASDMVVLLLELGADISVVDSSGRTPLFAALLGVADADVVALLVEYGADIDAKNADGETACQFASNHSSLKENDAILYLVCP